MQYIAPDDTYGFVSYLWLEPKVADHRVRALMWTEVALAQVLAQTSVYSEQIHEQNIKILRSSRDYFAGEMTETERERARQMARDKIEDWERDWTLAGDGLFSIFSGGSSSDDRNTSDR